MLQPHLNACTVCQPCFFRFPLGAAASVPVSGSGAWVPDKHLDVETFWSGSKRPGLGPTAVWPSSAETRCSSSSVCVLVWRELLWGNAKDFLELMAQMRGLVTIHAAQTAAQKAEAPNMLDECRQLFAKGLRGPKLRDAIAQLMNRHRPVAFIQLSKAGRGELLGKTTGMTTGEGRVQIGVSLVEVLRYAYDLGERFPQNRIVLPTDLVYSRYDYIDTKKQGGRDILRQELNDRMAIVARRETRKNLLMIVGDKSAPGLHRHNNSEGEGEFKVKNATMSQLAGSLSRIFCVTITDQTGLEGGFDYTLNAPYPRTVEDVKKAVSQLGLELVPAPNSEDIDFLVVQETVPRKSQ